MSKVTMLNGMPITMLNGSGLGCDCQNGNRLPVAGLPGGDPTGALVAAGTLLTIALLAGSRKPVAGGLSGIGSDILKDYVGKVVMVGAGLGAGYLMIVRPLLQKFGVIETKEDRKRDDQEQAFSTGNSAFSPNYYKSVPGAPLLKIEVRQALAKQLKDAYGTFNDAETQVYAALRQLQYKTQLSFLSEYFSSLYQKDLYQYLRGFLDDSEMEIVHGIVNNLK